MKQVVAVAGWEEETAGGLRVAMANEAVTEAQVVLEVA